MNIRQVRKKIKSVSNVKKITKAMEMVSAIKMKKAQQSAIEGKPYRQNLEKIIYKLVSTLDEESSPLMQKVRNPEKKDLVILVSSNKGLCGVFNFNLFRFVIKNLKFDQCDFITIGKKAAYLVNKMGGTVLADFSSGNPTENVSAIFQTILDSFLSGKNKSVKIIYNKFINTLNSDPVEKIILPVNLQTSSMQTITFQPKGEYIVEPSIATIVDFLLKSFVEEEIRGGITDSEAAEHSARMISMKNATENAEDVIYSLTLLRNKLRQERITYELLDMVTAKESVEAS